MKLYSRPELKHFFSRAASKSLHGAKAIYQPGALRKVSIMCTYIIIEVIFHRKRGKLYVAC